LDKLNANFTLVIVKQLVTIIMFGNTY